MTKNETISVSATTEFEEVLASAKGKKLNCLATLKACEMPESEEDSARAPVEVVLCLDVSGSMGGGKLDMVKKTSVMLVDELGSKDTLGIVAFESNVHLVFKTARMTEDGRRAAKAAIRGMRTMGSTNLSGGVLEAIAMLKGESVLEVGSSSFAGGSVRRLSQRASSAASSLWQTIAPASKSSSDGEDAAVDATKAKVKTVLMLTDGQANQGVTDAGKLERMVKSALGREITLNTFAYGQGANQELLQSLAATGGGQNYHVENVDDVGMAFGDCLGGLLSVVAQTIVVEIEAREGVRLSGFNKPDEKSEATFDDKRIELRLRDLFSEEVRNVLFETTLTSERDAGETQPLVDVRVTYVDVVNEGAGAASTTCSVARVAELADENALPNVDVARQVHRVRAAATLRRAVELADAGDLGACQAALQKEGDLLGARDERLKGDQLLDELASNVSEHIQGTKTRSAYEKKSKHKMRSHMAHYGMERSAASALSEADNVYQSKAKSIMYRKMM